jgi:hypothetical protein
VQRGNPFVDLVAGAPASRALRNFSIVSTSDLRLYRLDLRADA